MRTELQIIHGLQNILTRSRQSGTPIIVGEKVNRAGYENVNHHQTIQFSKIKILISFKTFQRLEGRFLGESQIDENVVLIRAQTNNVWRIDDTTRKSCIFDPP